MENEINYLNLIISLTVTGASFSWVYFVENEVKKLFYLSIVLFYYLFCGITSFYADSQYYIWYYVIYTLVLGGTFFYTRNLSIKCDVLKTDNFYSFIKYYAKPFIIFYIVYNLFQLVYPENKIMNLFVLPQPDISLGIEKQVAGNTIFESLNYLLNILFLIFLSTYIDKPKKIVLLYFFVMYLTFAATSYLSRGAILRLLVLIFVILYLRYPQKRKLLILSGLISSFFLIIFFVAYMYIRMGQDASFGNFSFAIKKIADVEFTYSQYFDQTLKDKPGEPLRFLWWFVSLPLPGFLKFGSADYLVNIEYTEKTLGLSRENPAFFTILPGLVIEGVYMLGTKLFFLHAVLFAFMINVVYNTLLKSKAFLVLCLYYIINIPFVAIRGGSISFYPTTNKLLPYIFIILITMYKLSGYISKKRS